MYKHLIEKSDQILKLYNEGMLLNEIALTTSSSTVSVKKLLLNHGIDYEKIKKEDYQFRLNKIIPMYESGIPQITIEKDLKLTRKTIRTILKNSSVVKYKTKSEQQSIYYGTEIDDGVFDILLPESLYWIGMLYTDGHIDTKHESQICLTLHNNDIQHLEKLKTFFKSNRDIKPDHGDCSRIRINSKKLVNKLIDLGFTSNKSLTIEPHELLKYSRDFWRGCLDGDGGIYNNRKDKTNHLTLTGTQATVLEFIQFCTNNCSINKKQATKSPGVNLYCVSYYSEDALKVAKLLYQDSIVSLDRKYKIYQSWLQK